MRNTNIQKAVAGLFFPLVLLVLALAADRVDAQSKGPVTEAERITGDSFPVSAKTPKGANIYAVSQPSPEMVGAIDKGLTDLFAVARKNGYSRHLNYSDYTIFIAKADRTKDSA